MYMQELRESCAKLRLTHSPADYLPKFLENLGSEAEESLGL